MSNRLLTASLIPLLLSTAYPAHAEKGDVLKILGGVAAGLAVGAVANQSNDSEAAQFPVKQQSGASKANIQWSDTAKPKAAQKMQRYDQNVEIIQKVMKIRGYYSGKVNGHLNPETLKALNDYEAAYQIPKTTTITDKTLDRLEPIATRFPCSEDYITATKTTKGDRDALINKSRDEVDYLINDFQEYTKANNSTIDASTASKKIIAVNDAQRSVDNCFVSALNDLESYTKTVQGFAEYRVVKKTERSDQETVLKNTRKQEIDIYKSFADQYLLSNLGNEKAVNLKAELDKQPAVDTVSLAEYETYLSNVQKMIESDYSINAEYIAWNSKRLQNQVIETGKPEKKSFWGMFKGKNDSLKTVDQNKDPLSTSRFKYEIIKTYETMIVGNQFTETKASDNASFVVIEYSYKNISGKPVGSFKKPKVYLKDNNGQKYKADSHATSSYQLDHKIDLKLFSDVNPGVTIKTAEVFEIGRDTPKTGWTILIEADEDVVLPLILNNQQNYKMSKNYQELPASQRKQVDRVEEDPTKLWEALAEIDAEVKRQDSINNFYKQYR